MFWDRKGTIVIEYFAGGETINSTKYCKFLKKLKRAIRNKTGVILKEVCLMHDNSRLYLMKYHNSWVHLYGMF